MHTVRTLISVAALLLAVGCTKRPVVAQHVVFADDFAGDPLRHGWYWQGAKWERRGGKVGKAAWVGKQAIRVDYGLWRGPKFIAAPEQLYQLSYRSKAAHKGYWAVLSYDENGKEIPASPYSSVPRTTTWQSFETTVLIPDNAVFSRLLLWPQKTPVYVDDILLRRTNRADALTLADRCCASLPPLTYVPPPNRWRNLPRTRRLLGQGGELTLMVIGDSVANDLAHSNFHLLMERLFPGTRIRFLNKVGSGARPKDYLKGSLLQDLLDRYEPDLVLFGGMSTRAKDIPDLRRVAKRIRAGGKTEFLAFTDTMLVRRYWENFETARVPRLAYRRALAKAGAEDGFAVFDIGTAWEEYLQNCGKEIEFFRRDNHHANEYGKQIYGRLISAFLAAEHTTKGSR